MKKKGAEVSKAPNGLADLNIELQHKNIELLNAMHSLAKRMDDLISIFEEAAKNVASVEEDTRIKELADKLETLLDQNKGLADGLLMLEKYVRSKSIEMPFKRT